MTKSVNKAIGSYRSFYGSFGYAFKGIKHVFKNERNFRLHILSSVMVLFLAFYFKCDLIEFALLIISMTMVFVAEIINSTIEYTWNKLEPNHHPVVAVIKDSMAGAVLISAISALMIGIIVILRHL
ncbi:MAG: diacylglycerol kinase family protein [bacterium]